MNDIKKHDVAIIGTGPAGISAAIYLKRAGIDFVIFEKETPGGTLNKTHRIENYPGYLDKEGTTLAFRMYSQLEELKVNLKAEMVTNVEKENDLFNIYTNNKVYEVKYIIIATGRVPKKLDVPLAEKFEGKGISYCAVCDGSLYKGKDVLVVGGGNTAMETANYMSTLANTVTIINRSSILRADKKEQDDALVKNNVSIIYDSKITEIISKNDVITGVKLNNGKKINVSAIFVCIGQDSTLAYYQNLNLKTEKTGIVVDCDMKTSIDNVYACGDAIHKKLYQVVTATAEGAVAASSIISKLNAFLLHLK